MDVHVPGTCIMSQNEVACGQDAAAAADADFSFIPLLQS